GQYELFVNGSNALGVMLGNGMYNVPATSRYTKFTGSFGPPKLIAQLHLFYANGTSNVISTDSQWLTAPGPITFSHVYGGEDYDARLEPSGWNHAGFDAAAWSPATVTSGPGGMLRGQSHAAPPIKAVQTLLPIKTNSISASVKVYDLGQNASLIPRLTVHGQTGAVVRITPAELVNGNGTINRSSVGGGAAYWQYTLAGTGSETWFPRFFFHGCRYLQVEVFAAPSSAPLPVVDQIEGVVIQSASTPAGGFSCSSDLFNRIRTLIRWSQRNNLVSLITDCPHRERLGWLEQYHLHGPSLRYEWDLGLLYSKTMDDMTDSQLASGLVPDIAPEYTVFGGGFRDSPEWGSSVVIVPWQQYLFTGDDMLLRRHYNSMSNYLAYLQGRASGYILNFGLGDWYDLGPNPPGFAQLTPVALTATAYFYQDATILAQAARVIGRTNDALQFDSLAGNIRTAFNNSFYSAANGYYSTGSQTAQSLPLVLGLVHSNNQATVITALIANVRSQGLTAGDIGHRYLLRALADAGRSDVVFELHSQTNTPGYGYILNTGATSLTEGWDGSSSQSHFMLGHIMEWFYHDLAGIQPDAASPGFKRVVIKPALVSGITNASASYDSVRGEIASAWTLSNNVVTLNLTIPAGSTGLVCLPTLGTASTNLVIQENGTTLWQNGGVTGSVPGVTFDRMEGTGAQSSIVWTVGSGSYQFTWNVFPAPGGLAAVSGNAQVALSWNAMPDATGYHVKRSSNSGGPYVIVGNQIAGTNYTDVAVVNGATYYYVVSALSANNESGDSIEVSAMPRTVANFGFETPGVGTYLYSPAGSSWTFSAQSGANGSGIAANGSAFTTANPNAPQGIQVAYLQGIASVSQAIGGFTTGARYAVTFSAAQRNYQQNGGQTWNVTIDGSVVRSFDPPRSATSYVDYNLTFPATAPTHTLGFASSNTRGGDNTVFLDNVRITSLVPPALGWQASGGQIHFAWPQDHIGWRLQAQTNALSAGLGTNWVTITSSVITNQFAFPIGNIEASVFFRLIYP
ncbi:MAG: family 78 glycoside hydrolase catalytic domain, partial [Akkermansiaceae bacterium]|nr:family 78 glycoside hydrolase catalytic domain [Verrucomicrobiales bacterium]